MDRATGVVHVDSKLCAESLSIPGGFLDEVAAIGRASDADGGGGGGGGSSSSSISSISGSSSGGGGPTREGDDEPAEVFLVGSYAPLHSDEESRATSAEVASATLAQLIASSRRYTVVVAAVLAANTRLDADGPLERPCATSLILDCVSHGAAFPGSFAFRGPLQCLRNARLFREDESAARAYDSETDRVIVTPFEYLSLPKQYVRAGKLHRVLLPAAVTNVLSSICCRQCVVVNVLSSMCCRQCVVVNV